MITKVNPKYERHFCFQCQKMISLKYWNYHVKSKGHLKSVQVTLKNTVDNSVKESEKYPKSRTKGLEPFQPGQSGNPGGRPKGTSITSQLRKLLDQMVAGKHISEAVAQAWLKKALKGSYHHLREMLERTEGKVPNKNENTGADGGPIRIDMNSFSAADLTKFIRASGNVEDTRIPEPASSGRQRNGSQERSDT